MAAEEEAPGRGDGGPECDGEAGAGEGFQDEAADARVARASSKESRGSRGSRSNSDEESQPKGVTRRLSSFLGKGKAASRSHTLDDENLENLKLEEIEALDVDTRNGASSQEVGVAARYGTQSSVNGSFGAGRRPTVLRCIVSSKWFDAFTGLIIVANSLTIGLEQSFRKEGGNEQALEAIGWLEHFFLGFYIVELALCLAAFGRECLHDNWVRFDLVLVILGVSTAWIVEPIFGQDRGELAPLMVIRTMRLLRLARMVRLLVKFRVLWMLVRGLLNSAGTMFYTLVLLLIILYVFSAVGIEIITNSPYASGPEADEDFKKIADAYFNSLPSAMLTLMQFVCLDSIGAIYRPLIQKDVTLAVYFAMIILVIPIVVMNLVTAIIVNSALEQAMQDKEAARVFEEQKRARLIKKLRLIFLRLDDDNSGQVSREELAKVNEKDMALLCESTNISDPMEIFAALDIDGGGQISIDEFCDGIWQVVASKAPLEVQRMEKQVAVIFKRLKEVELKHSAMQDVIDEIIQVQESMQEMILAGPMAGGELGCAALGAAAVDLGKAQRFKAELLAASAKATAEAGSNEGAEPWQSDSREAHPQFPALEEEAPVGAGAAAGRVQGAALPAAAGAAAAQGGVGRGAPSLSKVHEGPACEPLCLQTLEEGEDEEEEGFPNGAAFEDSEHSRTESKLHGLETIQASELVDSIPDLMQLGTEKLEGGPAWARELLFELRHLSVELAPTSCSARGWTNKSSSTISLGEETARQPHPSNFGVWAPIGPPESARPLLFADRVDLELAQDAVVGPPLPPQSWPHVRADL